MLRLAKAEELKPILTPRQELEKMQQQNPSIAKLIEQLGLQLELKHYTNYGLWVAIFLRLTNC